MSWDFSKLPAHEHARAIAAIEAMDFGVLIELHDSYKLSPYTYCCNKEGLLVWFRYGVASGQIKLDYDEEQRARTSSAHTGK